jgi:hypothetical protein
MIEHLHAIAAHAYYADELDAGRRACEQLLRQELPPGLEPLVRRNRTWYTQLLEESVAARFVRLDVDCNHREWSLFNPSIVAADDGWTVNVRSSNYRIVDGRYIIPEEDGEVIRTENILVDLDEQLLVSGVLHKVESEYDQTTYPVSGLEDVRLNRVGELITCSATVRNWHPFDGTCRIASGTLDRRRGAYVDLCCPATAQGVHEKNWMPIAGRREWLYACSVQGHTATVRQEPGGAWQVTIGSPAPHLAAGFRGGSQLVPIGNALWLAIVHEVAEDGGRRIYEHRFVEFDEAAGWSITGVSRPFAFRELRAIEFAAGLARKEGRLVASFGVRDAEAWLVELDLREVCGLLERP